VAERPHKPQRQQRPVALADQRVGAECQHAGQHARSGRRLALFGGADGAADAAEHGLHALGVGRRLVAGNLVVVADRGGAAADRAGL